MSTQTSDVTYVDAEITPAANYVGGSTEWGASSPTYRPTRVWRPPLAGHVHVRTSDRCIHNDHGPLCPDPTR